MELQNISATLRETGGKGPVRRVRAKGLVPGTLYGGADSPVSLALETRAFDQLVHGRGGEHAVVQINIQPQADLSTPALLKSVQREPISGKVLHADFLRIRLDERIETVTPIVLVGQARGVVDGGVLDHQLRELEIECLALETPEKIEVNIVELTIGHSVLVNQLTVPEGVKVLSDPDRPVVTVHAPRVAETAAEAAPVEGGEGKTEPEVITSKADKAKEKEKAD